MHALILGVKKTIRKYEMLQPGDKVVVGVSGGADSTALLYALWEVRVDIPISLSVAHLDHGLRSEGEKDAHFVRKLAGRLGVPFFPGKADVRSFQREKGLTTQEAAREVRYEFLQAIAQQNKATKIALGHTADDQAESMVIRILRGSGTRGLSGIPPVRNKIFIRPLIEIWREEVESFLKEKKVPFIQDPSNQAAQYLRNRVRHELLPILQRYNPRIRQVLVQMADLFRADEEFWQRHLEEKFSDLLRSRRKDHWVLDIPSLMTQPLPIRLRCFRYAIEKLQGHLRRVNLPHIMAIHHLVEGSDPNKVIRLPQGLTITRAYHALSFSRSEEETVPFAHTVPGPGYLEIPEIGREMRFEIQSRKRRVPFEDSPNVALLDFDGTDFPLTLRSFRPGDRFQPLGMEGEKKIKDLFIDCKIPVMQRKRIPLLFQGDRLLWVVGVRIDHRARLKPETQKVLRAELL
jgi:tRNA(Ile)-lysidine synthase